MLTTAEEVVPYLLAHNLLSAEAVVDGDLTVEDVSQRNRNFKVISSHGPSYLLKQGIGPDGATTVAREAAIYGYLTDRENAGFSRYLPRFQGYDPEERVLILELVSEAEDLREYQARRGRFSTGQAAALGDALGRLHRLAGTGGGKEPQLESFAHGPAWALSMHRPTLAAFREISWANVEVIKIIQRFAEFGALLDELRQEWKAEALVHFDLRWDNCLVSRRPPARKTSLKIVDWEFAGPGDPCWDVGSIFSNYLSFWVISMPITGDMQPEQFPEFARYPLVKMQPAIRSFWRSYVRRMELDSRASDWLMRAVKYSAARLLETAYTQMQSSVQVTSHALCLLQLSLNMLQRPHEASVHLLGIPLNDTSLA